MTGSYEEMMGTEQDPADHPATNMPQATQHYAGDVLPLPVNMGAGMLGQAKNNESIKGIAAGGPKSVDTTNLVLHPGVRKQFGK